MENESMSEIHEISLDPFYIPPRGKYPIFFLGVIIYLFAIFCNMTLLALIIFERKLHTPMYFILFSLPLNDLVGITAMLPKLLHSIVSKDRSISYPGCFLQALLIHIYGSGNFLFLTAMAYDRYIAICLPLRYHSLMTSNILIRIIVVVWLFDIFIMVVLFGISTRSKFCMNNIVDVFCNNPSLVKLLCEDSSVVAFGLAMFSLLLPLVFIIFSYFSIIVAVVRMSSSDGRTRALSTCTPQLFITCLYYMPRCFVYLANNVGFNFSDQVRIIVIMLYSVLPAAVNPVIYCFKTKDIKETLKKRLNNRKATVNFF
ncbi:unnamed protein product [Lota lota]